MKKRSSGTWLIRGPGWFLVLYLIYAQAISAVNYERGVAMGTQESAEQITAVGAAFWYGFAFGDLVIYIPLLVIGLIGEGLGRCWGRTTLLAALGITIYWPIVSLAAIVAAREADGWRLPAENEYWTILPLIALWGAWSLWWISKKQI